MIINIIKRENSCRYFTLPSRCLFPSFICVPLIFLERKRGGQSSRSRAQTCCAVLQGGGCGVGEEGEEEEEEEVGSREAWWGTDSLGVKGDESQCKGSSGVGRVERRGILG